jgi:hypothetical protein
VLGCKQLGRNPRFCYDKQLAQNWIAQSHCEPGKEGAEFIPLEDDYLTLFNAAMEITDDDDVHDEDAYPDVGHHYNLIDDNTLPNVVDRNLLNNKFYLPTGMSSMKATLAIP